MKQFHKKTSIQGAEWDKVQRVLLCEPSLATLLGALAPWAVNFKASFSLHQAQREHQRFQKTLASWGVEVIEIRKLLKGLSQPEDILQLQQAAATVLNRERRGQRPIQIEDLAVFEPEDLMEIIFLQPEIILETSPQALDETTRFKGQYRIHPLTNHFFLRDPLMTTKEGVILCSLKLDQRKKEVEVLELILDILGIEPLCQIQFPGQVEGGDFLPAGDYVLQGQGLLTNREGVKQLLERGAYGEVEVAVVKDPAPTMEAMHLDTYFNFLSPDLAVIQKERMAGPLQPQVDIYWPEGKRGYGYVGSCSFSQYLAEKGVQCIPFSSSEQERFAPNFLLLQEKRLIGVEGAGEEFFRRLEEYGVKGDWLGFSSLTQGYGGPHCMSQVLIRHPQSRDMGHQNGEKER